MCEFSAEYMAGFFDGEGYVGIHRDGVLVSITQVDRRPLEWLRGRFGGSVARHGRPMPSRRPCSQWVIGNRKAMAFLEWIRPYAVLKAPQIEIAMVFAGLPKRGRWMTDEERGQREGLRVAIAAAKH